MLGKIRIGTRGSPLAKAQAEKVLYELKHKGYEAQLVAITTSGDRLKNKSLALYGGKMLFTKEIEEALLENRVDIAVHSLKDMETVMAPQLALAAVLKRHDPRDAFISVSGHPLEDLGNGPVIGTASPRRAAQTLAKRPDAQIVLLRGNVQTRISKVNDTPIQGTFLAMAGLKRLGLCHHATTILPINEMVPAVGQGTIGIQCRKDDPALWSVLQKLNDPDTWHASLIERAFLQGFQGSCSTPIGGHYDGQTLYIWAGCALGCHVYHHEEPMVSLDLDESMERAKNLGKETFLKRQSWPCKAVEFSFAAPSS